MKANNGPRSKFSVLPHQARWRAYNLILDGATLRALLSDPELGNALKLAGITLNAPNLTRIKQSKEFAEFAKMRREHLMGRERDLMLTAIAQDTGTADSMSDQVKVKLLAVLDELTDLPDLADEDKVKAVRSLAQSLTQLSNTAKDNRIESLNRKLREKDEVIADKDVQIAKLKTEIERLTTKDSTVADPAKVADELSNLLGVKK